MVPKRRVPPTLRIYNFRSPEIEAGESMLAANGISFFPYPSRYAVRYEGESPYTAMEFAKQIKNHSLAELLSMQLLPYEILEIDDGIRPYCFLVERLGRVRCIRFKSDIARKTSSMNQTISQFDFTGLSQAFRSLLIALTAKYSPLNALCNVCFI